MIPLMKTVLYRKVLAAEDFKTDTEKQMPNLKGLYKPETFFSRGSQVVIHIALASDL